MQIVEEGLGFGDGEGTGLADVLGRTILRRDEHGAGFGAETLAPAVGTEGVPAVFGEEDADVEFVLFAFEGAEEALDAGVGSVAFFDEALLVGFEIVPGDVSRDVGGFCGTYHLAMVRAIFCGAPGRDRSVGERLRLIGKDEVGIEVDGIAEALAAWAGAVGVVEGEESRFRFAVGAMAGGALKCYGETELCGLFVLVARHREELDFAGFAVTGLDGVDDAGAKFRIDCETVDEDEDRLGEVEFEEGFGGGEFDDFIFTAGSLLEETVVAAATEFGEAFLESVGKVEIGGGDRGFNGLC